MAAIATAGAIGVEREDSCRPQIKKPRIKRGFF
jgi:hypothetical protein